MRYVSITKQITTISMLQPIHILFLNYIYSIPTLQWLIPSDKVHKFIKISTQCKENRICQKQNNLQKSENFVYFYNSNNSKKIGKSRKIVCQSCIKNSEFYHVPVNFRNSSTGHKSFCFYTESSQLSPTLSQRLYLAFY